MVDPPQHLHIAWLKNYNPRDYFFRKPQYEKKREAHQVLVSFDLIGWVVAWVEASNKHAFGSLVYKQANDFIIDDASTIRGQN